jgi:hypothetical protein
MTSDVKAQLAQHFTAKLPKPHGNRLLIIGTKVGTPAKMMEPHCSEIHVVAEAQYVGVLEALFASHLSVEYRFNTEGFIGQNFTIPRRENPHCTYTVIEVSKFHEYVKKKIHYDVVILQSVIVHPEINILKQLMRVRHDVLMSMLVPGKLAHQGLFELVSGIERNILHVFYTQTLHEKLDYIRFLTGRAHEINIWEVFVWTKKRAEDAWDEIRKV